MANRTDNLIEHKSVRIEQPLGEDVMPEIERVAKVEFDFGWYPVGVIMSTRSRACYLVFERLSPEHYASDDPLAQAFRTYGEPTQIIPLDPDPEAPAGAI